MSDLIVVAFDDPANAFRLRARLAELQKEYLIDMDDVVVVTREENGKIKLHQPTNMTAAGAVGGGFWGLLIGILFLNPLLGLAIGAGAGALSGRFADLGISNDFMRDVGQEVHPGGAAVFVLARKVTKDKVLESLQDFTGEGTVLQTSLSQDDEQKLRDVLEAA